VVQGEIYTQGKLGELGHQAFDFQKAQAETPEYVVFNGRVGALTGPGALRAKVGETIRIFFGNGGPNLVSSFHVIGGILDRVYSEGAIVSPPIANVQTTLVPAGGSVMVEFKAEVSGNLILVDHSLFRINRGAVGIIAVEGPPNPEIFASIKNATTTPGGDTHQMTTTTATTAPTSSQAGNVMSGHVEVVIQNYLYTPAQITILAGTTVTWTNRDADGHTVTEGNPNAPKQPTARTFDSSNEQTGGAYKMLGKGDTYSFTFTQAGTYRYYCIPHPYMIGTIVVVAGGSQGQGGTSPPTLLPIPDLGIQGGWLVLVGAVVIGAVVGYPLGRRRTTDAKISTVVAPGVQGKQFAFVCDVASCKSLATWRVDYLGQTRYYCDPHKPTVPPESLRLV
jgi:plastocyanin